MADKGAAGARLAKLGRYEVLSELGYDDAEIARLREDGAV